MEVGKDDDGATLMACPTCEYVVVGELTDERGMVEELAGWPAVPALHAEMSVAIAATGTHHACDVRATATSKQ